MCIAQDDAFTLSSGPVPPEEPPSLTYSFVIMQTNITAKLMWEQPASVVEITSYRLVWGQTVQEPDQLNPVLNQDTALTKVVPKVCVFIKLNEKYL